MEFVHDTVLLNESVDMLDIKPSGVYVDATMGGCGHSKLILSKLNESGRLICFDQDQIAIDNAAKVFADCPNVTIIKSNFCHLKNELSLRNIDKIDGILFDLGVSSMQIDQEERGFSYRFDGPLDMRMDQNATFSAFDVINGYPLSQLIKIFDKYGEEKNAKVIARKIIAEREIAPIKTTKELNDLVLNAISKKDFYNAKSHPAKRVFQAVRIEVNKELVVFENTLADCFEMLNLDGKIAVITFHSLEDRICKYMFREQTQVSSDFANLPVIPPEYLPLGKLINKKPILESPKNMELNSRARSAKLRGFVRCK